MITKGPENLTRERPTVATSSDGSAVIFTTTEVWRGPYAQCEAMFNSLWPVAKTLRLAPDDAGHGSLTATYETTKPIELEESEDPVPVFEVIWQELRQPVEQNPDFSDLTAEDIQAVDAALSQDAALPTGDLALKLYALKVRGVTEYAIGVPVVRATETGWTNNPGSQQSWVRDTPPGESGAPGGYDYLLTASEIRKEGKTWNRVREWTGAKKWDLVLYPE